MYKVVEKFVSINGEGERAGTLAVFIRFVGCNLHCSYCDTMWANALDVSYEWMSENDIYDYIASTGVVNVTLTGGEPLLQKGMETLLQLLSQKPSLSIEIETNGSVDIEPYVKLPVRLTMDYKLASSLMEDKMLVENFVHLRKVDTVKFVVGSVDELCSAKELMDKYQLLEKCHVHISPIYGNITMAEMVDFMKDNQMNGVKLQPQLHKIIWEPTMRGV